MQDRQAAAPTSIATATMAAGGHAVSRRRLRARSLCLSLAADAADARRSRLALLGTAAAGALLATFALVALLALTAPRAAAQNRQIELEWLRNAGITFAGAASTDETGSVVAPAGDVNGDGHADLLIGAWTASPGGMVDAGLAYLVFGGPQAPQALALGELPSGAGVLFTGDAAGAQAGFSLAAAGDVNGDGFDDLLIGSPRSQPHGTASGRAYLVFGAPSLPDVVPLGSLGALGVTFNGIGDSVNPTLFSDLAGQSVAGPGDVNGDGYDDVLIGASGSSQAGIGFAGQTYLVYGGPVLPQVFELSSLAAGGGLTMNGIASSDQSGIACAAAGDVNGDGYRDLLVGAWQADPNGQSNAGQTYLVYGGPSLPLTIGFATLGAAGVRINGSATGLKTGRAIAGGGDVNGDGYDDLLIGNELAPGPGGVQCGGAFLVYGGPSLPQTIALGSLGAQGVTMTGIDANDRAGSSVALGGDVNRDGLADMAIGAGTADPNGDNSAGEVYLVHGSAALPAALSLGALGPRGVVLAGVAPGDASGHALAFAGDVDGDGFDELLVGAPFADPAAGSTAGEARLVKGAGHFLQAAGTVAEGGTLPLRAHGAPGTFYVSMVSLAALPAPIQTGLGPFWLVGHFDLFVAAFGANGESQLTFFMPGPGEMPGLQGLTVHMQVLGQPQGGNNDLTNLLSFVVE